MPKPDQYAIGDCHDCLIYCNRAPAYKIRILSRWWQNKEFWMPIIGDNFIYLCYIFGPNPKPFARAES